MSVCESLREVRQEIVAACAAAIRDPSLVRLVAVSKRISPELIAEAYQSDQRLFGENYVQEALGKFQGGPSTERLFPEADVHLIGPLQSNKVKRAIELFSLIHSVGSLSLAEEISKRSILIGKVQAVLLQINISQEESKSGVSPRHASELLVQALALPGIEVRGLMTIGSVEAELYTRAREFAAMSALRGQLELQHQVLLPELSMGMSDDFALAVAHGATLVRVGTRIFGARVS